MYKSTLFSQTTCWQHEPSRCLNYQNYPEFKVCLKLAMIIIYYYYIIIVVIIIITKESVIN